MVKYSRTSKYEELRNRLQNDAEVDINNRDLSSYEQRLHRINATNFAKPQETETAESKDPIHARRKSFYEPQVEEPVKQEEVITPEPEAPSLDPRTDFLHGNENYTSTFNNEYLDEYIKEVKKYNVEHGNSTTMSTDLNILRALKGEPDTTSAPKKPYADAKQPEVQPTQDTADIPFFVSNGDTGNLSDFLNDEDYSRPPLSDTRTMTKEDIAAEVQNLIKGATYSNTQTLQTPVQQTSQKTKQAPSISDTAKNYYASYEADRTARQQLLNETTQMRAQLDDYEDNLTEVSDKMRHTNQILNIVLIILIVALLVVLAVVVYWLLSSRGIL